jgi:FlaA1/EpsC-like NDP-sugar epimerase
MSSVYSVHSAPRGEKRNAASLASDLLPLGDFAWLFLAASLSNALYAQGASADALVQGLGNNATQTALIAAVLAPFVLYDKHFGAIATRGQARALVHSYARRFALFTALVLALSVVSQTLENVARGGIVVWFIAALLSTALTRLAMARYLRHLQRQGVLTEVIAIVGAGPVADRLVQVLRQTRPETIELLGVFDDDVPGTAHAAIPPTGTLEQLIELGKTRTIDWILLTPPAAEDRLPALVQRLKTLSAPIGLCSPHIGLSVPCQSIDYVADSVPVSLLADRPIKRWHAVVKATEDLLPRWIITAVVVPPIALAELATRLFNQIASRRRDAE